MPFTNKHERIKIRITYMGIKNNGLYEEELIDKLSSKIYMNNG